MSENGKGKWIRAWIFGVIAFLLVTLTPGYFVYRYITFDTRIAQGHFFPVDIPPAIGTDTPEDRKKAFAFYRSGEYPEAAVEFDNVLKSDLSPEDIKTITFFKGVSQLGSCEFKAAHTTLTSVVATTHPYYQGAAEWYLSLASIGSHKMEEGKSLLQKMVADTTHDYHRSAVDLLPKL